MPAFFYFLTVTYDKISHILLWDFIMYFLEMLSLFLMFLFIGAFFSPFIGGCFGVVLIFTILIGFVIFFSLNFVWFLAAGIILYVVGFINKYRRYQKLPEINQYLLDHPQCKLDVGVACDSCGSSELTNRGLFSNTGRLRYYTCSQCGSNLFRFKVL